MLAIARAHRRFGTTACLPTMITDTRDRMRLAIEAARHASGRAACSACTSRGLSSARPGPASIARDLIAQATDRDLDWLLGLAEAGRSMVTLAPECVPAGFVKRLAAAGIMVSLGHSEASAETVGLAADDGLTGVTHLFNAMPAMAARLPGPVGAALADRRLTASLVVDGIHVDPVAIRAAYAAKGAERIALVTDAMPTVGAAVAQFSLMGRAITLAGGRLVDADNTLAGAHLDMTSAGADCRDAGACAARRCPAIRVAHARPGFSGWTTSAARCLPGAGRPCCADGGSASPDHLGRRGRGRALTPSRPPRLSAPNLAKA
jgi:N-acetylglucosamine-6-phosphate deacetylase